MDWSRVFVLAAIAVSCLARSASAGIVVTAEAPGVQSSQVAGVTTETFDGFAAAHYTSLSTAVGTITSADAVVSAANQFGGAGGAANYLAIRNLQTATLTLPAAQGYFGMWWSAADLGNVLSFYSGATLIGSFVPATALGALGSSYLGNPNGTFPPNDPTEKFAYLNFVGVGGTTFDRIVVTNTDSSTAFETDNWSIRVTAPDPHGPPIETFGSPVPEPSSLIVAGGLAVLVATGAVRRRRALTTS